jgi:hypothetical protein
MSFLDANNTGGGNGSKSDFSAASPGRSSETLTFPEKTKHSKEVDMLRIDHPNENKVVTVTVSKQLTKEDYQRLLPELEEMLKQYGALRFYIELKEFSGFEMGALWEDIKFDYKHKNQYGKTAIVGDKHWEEWGTKISKLFFDAEMKFFYEDQSDEAWSWVND